MSCLSVNFPVQQIPSSQGRDFEIRPLWCQRTLSTSSKTLEKSHLGYFQPKMCITYTCRVCGTRSSKTFSKVSYEKGVVLVRCSGCNNLHLIADNLGYFKEVGKTWVVFFFPFWVHRLKLAGTYITVYLSFFFFFFFSVCNLFFKAIYLASSHSRYKSDCFVSVNVWNDMKI